MHDSNTPCGYTPPPTIPPRLTLRFGPDGHTFQALDEHGRDLSDTLRVTAVTASVKCGELAKATVEIEGCEVDASVFVEQPNTSRAVDDALDAAGAPHTDERGSLTAAQRVAWLAGQRDKWRACTTTPSEVNLHGPHIAEAREPLLADFVSKHPEAYRDRAGDRVAKAMAQLDMPTGESDAKKASHPGKAFVVNGTGAVFRHTVRGARGGCEARDTLVDDLWEAFVTMFDLLREGESEPPIEAMRIMGLVDRCGHCGMERAGDRRRP